MTVPGFRMDKMNDNINNSVESEARIEAFRDRCHQAHLKVTPQREAVYRALIGTQEHPSADNIFRHVRNEMPSLSLDTVSRTLNTLARIGAAFIVEGSGDAKRFDGNLEDHQHFKCINCKKIIDYHHEPFDHIVLPDELGNHFVILRKTVYIEGLCDDCSQANN